MNTRKPVFFIALNGSILLLVFFFLMQSILVVHMLGTIDRLEGGVEIRRRDGNWKTAHLLDVVHASDMVRTGPNSNAELRWQDGTRIRLGPNATLAVKKYTQTVGTRNRVSLFDLSLGKVWIRLIRPFQPRSRFEVETPTAVAMAMGTIFSVEAMPDRTEVQVLEGTVRVRDSQQQETSVSPGSTMGVMSQGSRLGPTTQYSLADWSEREGIVGPGLILSQPDLETQAVSDSPLVVKGYVEPGALLQVNGQRARVLPTGGFSLSVPLVPGRNVLSIVASDRKGRQTSIQRELVLSAER